MDLFIESCRASGRLDVHAVRIASRLLAAGRAAEALRTLDGQPPGRRRDRESRELRIAALDALGSGEEAQTARWDEEYVATLKERHGRKYGFWSKVAAATSEPTVATKRRSRHPSDASGPT